MGLIIVFFLGIANFAMHRAVVESGHPIFAQFVEQTGRVGALILLSVELALLIGALAMVQAGFWGWVIAYGIYSAVNGVSAWMILSNRL